MAIKTVLFICTHNSARSQMAEAMMNHYHKDSFKAYSAGTIVSRIDPRILDVMAEMGIDMSGHRSKSIEEFRGWLFDIVITLCDDAQKACPFFPGARKQLHHGFQDPSMIMGVGNGQMDRIRQIRDDIRKWLETLTTEEISMPQSKSFSKPKFLS